MRRLFVTGYTKLRPNGVKEIFGQGVYNIEDDLFAEHLLEEGVAAEVDADDQPLWREPEPEPEPEPSRLEDGRPVPVIMTEELTPELGDNTDEEED